MKMGKRLGNREIAELLRAVSAAYVVKNANRFKIAAYNRAAASIEHATSEVKDLWDDGKLDEIPGVGKSIAGHLDELFRKGKVTHFEKVMKSLPPAMFELLKVPGIGAKTSYKLSKKLGIRDEKGAILKLKKAVEQGKLLQIEGFREKTQENILEAIKALREGKIKENRMALPMADGIAKQLINYLRENPVTVSADPLGSLRRMVATIGDIDIAVSTRKPQEIIDWFLKYPKKRKIIEKGPSGASIMLENGRQVDLRVQQPQSYGAMLQYFTGSKQHNITLRELALKKGLSLSEYGIKKIKKNLLLPTLKIGETQEFADEKSFYAALSMDLIPPEMREDRGEIQAALGKRLPRLVGLSDIKGDLHMHSNYPIQESHDPGMDPMEKMIEVASSLGYEYIGFTEHNPSQAQHSQNDMIELIKKKKAAIEEINYSRVKKLLKGIFNGLEIDIKPSGQLAIPPKGLDLLDYGIASVHSNFSLPKEKMTQRVLRALQHPKIKILGHPTGRKLEEREGYELDWDVLFDFCQKNNKWLEVNAWPDRLDLPDVLVRNAVENGVKIVINTDSHSSDQLPLMYYGVSVARRGWATNQDIINTLSYDKIIEELKGGD